MLTLDELTALVKQGEIETVAMVFTDHYGRFIRCVLPFLPVQLQVSPNPRGWPTALA